MELTKVQRKILESLVEEGESSDRVLEEKYGINVSDSIREGSLFSDGGFISLKKNDYLEINYLDGFNNYNDLPEFTLLNFLENERVSDLDSLEKILKKQEIGPAINELKRLKLVETTKIDKDTPLIIEYNENENRLNIEKRNKIFNDLKTQNIFYRDSEEVYEKLKEIERRKLIKIKERSTYTLKILDEGRKLIENISKQEVTLLTHEMIVDGSWKDVKFKEYDPAAGSKKIISGKIHPLRQLALNVERIFRDMGYEFMTGGLVVDSFHNFDALFTPQDHPAREMQDTFFLEHPQYCKDVNEDLRDKVKETHEKSFKYEWDYRIAKKNILRTHTTAVTAKYLEERDDVPLKLFSIGRVFRNEKIDAMHLPEFHQIEGVVIGNVNLRDLMGHISTFYNRIGLEEIRFKKTFNPYTEPSMEIYAYHPVLKKDIEVGNSGMFRPEMLAQFGYEEQRAIAWGLALERLASIIYNKPKIKELIGVEVDIDWLRGESKLWL